MSFVAVGKIQNITHFALFETTITLRLNCDEIAVENIFGLWNSRLLIKL